MLDQFSLKGFLRTAPNALLSRYFQTHGLNLGIDVGALKPTDIEPIAQALERLEPERLKDVEADFQRVHLMATAAGAKALLQELRNADAPVPFDAGGRRPDLLAAALSVLLDRPEVFRTATLFRPYFDQNRYWRKVSGLGFQLPAEPKSCCTALSDVLKSYLRVREGRGRNCVVEHYRRDGRHFYFAFPEDYPQALQVWQNGVLRSPVLSPAFQMVFVVAAGETLSLDVYAQASKKESGYLADAFSEVVFGRAIPPEAHYRPVYDLSPLKRRGFEFAFGTESGIARMRVRRLRFAVAGKPRLDLTVAADIDEAGSDGPIHDACERVFATVPGSASDKIAYALARPTWAEIVVEFKAANRKGVRRWPFSIAAPNSCSLKHDTDDEQLRGILVASGIELAPSRAEAA